METRTTKIEAQKGEEILKGKKILVVEDDAAIRRLLIAAIGKFEGTAKAVKGAKEALKTLEQDSSFDLILTDCVMPDMSGQEFTEKITKAMPKIPVIGMSGYTTGGTECFETFLQKPIELKDLRTALVNALQQSEQEESTQALANLEGKKILCAVQEKIIPEIIKGVLEKINCVVDSVGSGKEGLDLIKNSPDDYDLIVASFKGETKDKIRGITNIIQISPNLRAILTTGNSCIDKRKLEKAGCAGVITTPPKTDALIKLLSEVNFEQKEVMAS